MNRLVRSTLSLLLLMVVAGCAPSAHSDSKDAGSNAALKSPAQIDKKLDEAQLNRIRLSADAEQKLGIRCTPVERQLLGRIRTYGGEVMIPLGRSSLVAAPLGGLLLERPGGSPRPGSFVAPGETVLLLSPLMTPEGRTALASTQIEADGQVKNARTLLDAAKIALDRAEDLLREQAGSGRAVDEAQAQFNLAQKTLEAAEARRTMLNEAADNAGRGTAAPLPMTSPDRGLLRAFSALPGQFVPSGAALFEVVDLSRVWVRVPVFVGELPQMGAADEAQIGELTLPSGVERSEARRISAPPSASALAGTVDLYFELENTRGWAPGQRVAVDIARDQPRERLAVPWSSVVFDIYGGSWVYERTAEHEFVRRRVVVEFVVADRAALAQGPVAGAEVVEQGAAELFGTEVGFSK